jgi:hypothetical protein
VRCFGWDVVFRSGLCPGKLLGNIQFYQRFVESPEASPKNCSRNFIVCKTAAGFVVPFQSSPWHCFSSVPYLWRCFSNVPYHWQYF